MKTFPSVERLCVHTFLPGLLSGDGRVVDLGANRGVFAKGIVERFGCPVHAIEPIPEFHDRLEQIPGVRAHARCLAPVADTVDLHLPEEGDATLYPDSDVVNTIQVRAETLEGFIEELAAPELDLLKLDVEGAELPALEQISPEMLLLARQITVEFHDWQRPENSGRVQQVQDRLRDIGFYCIRFSANNGDVLFVRKDLLRWSQYLYLALVVRNVRGALRIVRRNLGCRFWTQD